MTTNKKIAFIVVLVLIGASIGYLEAIKARPSDSSGGPSQAINIDANAPAATSTDANASGTAATSVSGNQVAGTSATAAPLKSLQALAKADAAAGYKPAIEIAGPTGFINASSTFTLKSLVGKDVVLLDFWTYSCINCIRTLPYLTAWYQKYNDQGFVIVGIHTPEFDFEKDINNVQKAVQQYGINYPVVLDSNMGTWDAYNNLYWPHEYLIDLAGYIVHDHVGEGSYGETEQEIQKLLAQRDQILGGSPAGVPAGQVSVTPSDLSGIGSPETYFGAERNALLANGYSLTNGTQTLTAPDLSSASLNQLNLGGTWNFEDQYATNQSTGATVIYKYDSSKVYIVASATSTAGVTVQVLQDGALVTGAAAGSDVHNGVLTVTGSRLYNLINNPDGSGEHTLELIVNSPGLQAFTFTFG